MTDTIRGQRATMNPIVDFSNLQELLENLEPPKKTKVATGCSLCDKIWEFGAELDEYLKSQDETSTLLIRDDTGVIGLCLHFVDADNFLIDADNLYVTSVEFCPKCGRRLIEE